MTQTYKAKVIAAAIRRNAGQPWYALSYARRRENNSSLWSLAYRWGVLPRVRQLLERAA